MAGEDDETGVGEAGDDELAASERMLDEAVRDFVEGTNHVERRMPGASTTRYERENDVLQRRDLREAAAEREAQREEREAQRAERKAQREARELAATQRDEDLARETRRFKQQMTVIVIGALISASGVVVALTRDSTVEVRPTPVTVLPAPVVVQPAPPAP